MRRLFARLRFPQVQELMNGVDGQRKVATFVQEVFHQLSEVAGVERFEPFQQVRFAAFVPCGPGVDDRAAAEGALGGFVAGDEAVAAQNR